MTDDSLSAALKEIREHLRAAEEGGLAEWSDGYIPSALYRWLRSSLAAVEAVLEVAAELDAEDGYRSEGDRIREAITRRLSGKEENGG